MSLSVANLVVAVNGVWILVETFMLKGEPGKGTGLSCGHTLAHLFGFFKIYIYLFAAVLESLLLGAGFSAVESRACLHRGAQASHCRASLAAEHGL